MTEDGENPTPEVYEGEYLYREVPLVVELGRWLNAWSVRAQKAVTYPDGKQWVSDEFLEILTTIKLIESSAKKYNDKCGLELEKLQEGKTR